jgi:hypothetical protein
MTPSIAALTGVPYTETDLQEMERLCDKSDWVVESKGATREFQTPVHHCVEAFRALIDRYRKEVL